MRNAAKVLIVDDDKSSSQLLSEVVKRMGMKPVVANKPADALTAVKLQTINAALVDVLLPKISGVDLATEFRKTKFADNPVVLVSGVFKDKAFANEAMRKSGAAEFLFKPFGAEELMEALRRVFGPLLTNEAWDVQALLMRPLRTARERAKAIEHLTPIKGPDFTFVMSLLTQVKISGHLNIVNNHGEIFGVSLANGMVSEVDSSESQSNGVMALISDGYLSQEDWDDFQRSHGKRFTLDKLVNEGLVSPHAVDVAKHKQILEDFKAICSSETLQVNFVPQEEGGETPKHAVGMQELITLMFQSVDEFFSESYLSTFYAQSMQTPLKIFGDEHALVAAFDRECAAKLKGFRAQFTKGVTLMGLLEHYKDNKLAAWQCFHSLVLEGLMHFEDVNQTKNLQAATERYQKVFKELKDLSPEGVFMYFGSPAKPSEAVVQNIYDTYLRSNDPDALPREASKELVSLSRKCFDIVKNAYDIMSDEQKRQEYYDHQKKVDDDKTRGAKEMMGEGLNQLRKGQFQQAVASLREAGKHHASTMQFLILTWAEIKSGIGITKPQLIETMKKQDALPSEEKRSAYYYMAAGLVKKHMGDMNAQVYFERAFQADSSFVEARRELNALNSARESKDKRIDLLTGDITEIVSSLFRRKSE